MMMRRVYVSVPGKPVGKGRPRIPRVGKPYTPKQTKEYEQRVLDCYRTQNPGVEQIPRDVPVAISITAYYPIPKSDRKKVREAKLMSEILPTVKPDIDNVIKAVLDGLQGDGGAITDDAQVTAVFAQSFYSANPRVDVTIERVRGWFE